MTTNIFHRPTQSGGPSGPCVGGISLIGLPVVIAIVEILAAILLPVTSNV